MLPTPPICAGTGGAPVESTAMRKVVSVVTAPAGKITAAPLASVMVPPSFPITGGGGGGGGTAGGGAGATGGGELSPPPPQPVSANNKTATATCVRMAHSLDRENAGQ